MSTRKIFKEVQACLISCNLILLKKVLLLRSIMQWVANPRFFTSLSASLIAPSTNQLKFSYTLSFLKEKVKERSIYISIIREMHPTIIKENLLNFKVKRCNHLKNVEDRTICKI